MFLIRSLTRLGSSMPGQLHEDAIRSLPRDQRLGHAELVDAVADRLDGLRDRVVLDPRGAEDP